jgi:transcriptional regulator with XRE-family HTH domain
MMLFSFQGTLTVDKVKMLNYNELNKTNALIFPAKMLYMFKNFILFINIHYMFSLVKKQVFTLVKRGRMRTMANDLGLRIRRLRKDAGLTVADLAEKAGITKSYLSMIENGKNTPSRAIIGNIARALGVASQELEAFEGGCADEKYRCFLQEADKLQNLLQNIEKNIGAAMLSEDTLVVAYNNKLLFNGIEAWKKISQELRDELLGDKLGIFKELIALDATGIDYIYEQMKLYNKFMDRICNR